MGAAWDTDLAVASKHRFGLHDMDDMEHVLGGEGCCAGRVVAFRSAGFLRGRISEKNAAIATKHTWSDVPLHKEWQTWAAWDNDLAVASQHRFGLCDGMAWTTLSGFVVLKVTGSEL